jgi:hypothetical protein
VGLFVLATIEKNYSSAAGGGNKPTQKATFRYGNMAQLADCIFQSKPV